MCAPDGRHLIPRGTAMTDTRTQFITDVDAAIGRLACNVVLDQTPAERNRTGAELMALVARLAATPWPDLGPVVSLLGDAVMGLNDPEGTP